MNEKQITIHESDKNDLLAFYTAKLESLKSECERVSHIIIQLNGSFAKNQPLTPVSYETNQTTAIYNSAWSWEERIIFALKEIGKVSQKATIVEKLIQLDSSLNNDNSRNSIGASLSRLSNDDNKKIGKLDIAGTRTYYGCNEWFKDGKVKKDFATPLIREEHVIDEINTIDLF